MVTIAGRGKLRLGILSGIALAIMATTGCGNPGEGTVTVSPEARARLRGGPAPESTKKASAKNKKPVDVREKMRKKPEE